MARQVWHDGVVPLLESSHLEEIRAALADRIRDGLKADGREIKALDAQLAPPRVRDGRALVVDIGGTNMRAAVVSIVAGRPTVERGPYNQRLDLREGGTTPAQFFAEQAKLAKSLDPEPGLPVGYCFSYPSEVLPSLDARLIRWTKGIDVPGVEGMLVGSGLADALRDEGLEPPCVHVLNDTVASMLGGALVHDGAPEDVIGLIAGTGSNMAAFFDGRAHEKLAGHDDFVAINLESGNFDCPHLTEADAIVDRESNNPGAQRFEKAISGFYMPFIYKAMTGDTSFDPLEGSAQLVKKREGGDEVAAALLERAALLIATGLAAVADARGGERPVAVIAEGSLFWRTPGFHQAVYGELDRLVDRAASIRSLEHANLIGSACAALA